MSVRVSGHAPLSPASRPAWRPWRLPAALRSLPLSPPSGVPLASVEQQYVGKHVCFCASFTMRL